MSDAGMASRAADALAWSDEPGVGLVSGHWLPIRDADRRARGLYRRHYSCYHYRDGRQPAKFVGPGEYMALMTLDCLALFVWKRWIDPSGETGVYNGVFHNEGAVQSSVLIREACELAWRRWPGARLYTYVNPRKIRSSNPGFCFLAAGWTRLQRKTGEGLRILECLPKEA